TARVRKPDNPAWCQAGSDHPSAKLMPMPRNGRHWELYDPKTKTVTPIDVCVGGSHANFDDNDVIWTSGGVGQAWFNTRVWDRTHDAKQANGWSAFVLDNNGNGKRDDPHTGPKEPADPTKD